MKRCKAIAAGIALSVAFLAPAHASSGIPTVDAAALASMAQQLQTLMEQVQTAKSQLASAEAQFKALTTSSGFGNLFNNPALQNALRASLPSKSDDLLNRNGNGSELTGEVNTIVEDVNAPVNFKEDRAKLAERRLNIEATSKAMSQRAYDAMTKRLETIDGLQAKIEATTNPKEISELQARIAIEQANVQTDQTRIQLANQQMEAERALLDARAEVVYGGWFGGKKTE